MSDSGIQDGHSKDGSPVDCTEPSCLEALERGDSWVGDFMSIEPNGIAHFHHGDRLHELVHEDKVNDYQKYAAQLTLDPDDFVAAWNYLQLHPVFYRYGYTTINDEASLEDALEYENLSNLVDDDGLEYLYTYVCRDDDGTPVVGFEHGPHTWASAIDPEIWGHRPINGMSSHDPDLDSWGATYEEAIVMLAGKVRDKYGDDREKVND